MQGARHDHSGPGDHPPPGGHLAVPKLEALGPRGCGWHAVRRPVFLIRDFQRRSSLTLQPTLRTCHGPTTLRLHLPARPCLLLPAPCWSHRNPKAGLSSPGSRSPTSVTAKGLLEPRVSVTACPSPRHRPALCVTCPRSASPHPGPPCREHHEPPAERARAPGSLQLAGPAWRSRGAGRRVHTNSPASSPHGPIPPCNFQQLIPQV